MKRGSGRSQALGGVAAQGTQAASSFVLQILAVRLLGAEGLGVFASIYGVVVLGTAINTGLVGDSLTVLGRHQRGIRAALQTWGLMVPLAFGIMLGVGAWAAGALTAWFAVALSVSTSLFLMEDLLRRLLMANFRFGRIVLVDVCGLTASCLTLVVIATVSTLEVGHFFVALAVGQGLALFVALTVLPAPERWWAPIRSADLGTVARYGSWRAVQASIKPALLAFVRIAGLGFVGAAAVGQLEASRVYLSPVLIVIGGLSTVMLARFAARKGEGLDELIRAADRSAAWISGLSLLPVGAALVLEPVAAPLLTGGDFALPLIALVGWGVYAVATGFTAPYSTLAAVRGSQRTVVGVRMAESAVAACVVLLVLWWSSTITWAPLLLGIGSGVGGLWLRAILKRQVEREP